MNESMRKIVYYENILEFKETTKTELNLKELNNWQLCRTCLGDTKANDADLEKICVMDVSQGRLLTAQEMLLTVTTLKFQKSAELPLKMCKECLGKITTLYFFSIQVRKAEEVLRRLSEKLRQHNIKEPTSDILEEQDTYLDIKEQLAKDETNDADILEEHKILILSTDDINQTNVSAITEKNEAESTQKVHGSPYLSANENVEDNTIMLVDNEEQLLDAHLFNEPDFETSNSMVDGVYLIDNEEEQLEADCLSNKQIAVNDATEKEIISMRTEARTYRTKTSKPKQSKIKKQSKVNFKSSKLRQPRVTRPLLENIKCGVCEKMFDRQHELVAHVKEQHPNSKAFECRDCGAFFSHTQSLSRHMNTHKPILNKNTCEYCSKSFFRSDDLRRHIRVHTGERPYSCPLCEKAFKQQGEMKQHLTIHLEDKKYECDQCDRVFSSRNSLYLHKKAHSYNSSPHCENRDTNDNAKFTSQIVIAYTNES